MSTKNRTITEADWRAAIEEDARAARTPPQPPPGFFDFPTWTRIFDTGRTATTNKLGELTRLGVLEVITHPAFDSAGRLTTRRFWRRVKGKGGNR